MNTTKKENSLSILENAISGASRMAAGILDSDKSLSSVKKASLYVISTSLSTLAEAVRKLEQ
jgi:hypothetical protein